VKIAVVGTGYVGLVTGTCFAESGNAVTCIDVDAEKIARLRRGESPIYEPGLTELIVRNSAAGRLRFATDLAEALAEASIVFVAVGTPQSESGAADLRALWSVVDTIGRAATEPKVVVIKSTVPVGTNADVAARLACARSTHCVASNPEFLKEGSAIDDFMRPDRVVVGLRDAALSSVFHELYAPFLRSGHPLLIMAPESAEMTKYAANCFLATKISFINEIANLCQATGADINEVRHGIGHDDRIGFQFLHPGVGYGGSCFPKDVRAMISLAAATGCPSAILPAVDEVNDRQKRRLFAAIEALLGEVAGSTIGIWGLAFKPRTDDIREAPALVLVEQLLAAGAKVRTYDPEATANVRSLFGDRLTYCDNAYAAAEGADVLAIATEWSEFRQPDFARLKRLMAQPIIVDGRNLYDSRQLAEQGFLYASIGRKTVYPADDNRAADQSPNATGGEAR